MSQPPDSFPPNPSDPGGDSSSRSGGLYWLLAVGAAVVFHLLVSHALFIAALPCALAAWKSFRCGFWLLRSDPVGARGRACWWFYLAVGCWKAAVTALVVGAVFNALHGCQERRLPAQRFPIQAQQGPAGAKPIQPRESEVITAAITALVGICLSSLIGIVAVVVAFRGRMRVWADTSLREHCHGDFNRLAYYVISFRGQPFNHAIPVLAFSLFLPILCVGTALVAWLGFNNPNGHLATAACLMGSVLAAPLVMIFVYAFLSSRIIARTPADCWPPTEES